MARSALHFDWLQLPSWPRSLLSVIFIPVFFPPRKGLQQFFSIKDVTMLRTSRSAQPAIPSTDQATDLPERINLHEAICDSRQVPRLPIQTSGGCGHPASAELLAKG